MKKIKILTIFCLVLMISGCSNFSPRSQQKINNPNGKIEEIKSVNLEVEVEDSDLTKMG